jgi:avidin family protein
MTSRMSLVLAALLLLTPSALGAGALDYGKRAQKLDKATEASLLGKWTNPVDHLVIEIDSVDLTSGKLAGTVSPTTGLAAADAHELIGWVNAAPARPDLDNVTPVSFSTTLYEYGTLPVWAGYLKDGKIVTMHYLVWPNKAYPWDHISAFQETWTKLP